MDSINDPETEWQRRGQMALASAVQSRSLITYAELADTAALPGPQRIHQLTMWLEDLMRHDHHAGNALRAAVVISRNRAGLPAPGFFILCRNLGIYNGPDQGDDAALFHRDMLARLFS